MCVTPAGCEAEQLVERALDAAELARERLPRDGRRRRPTLGEEARGDGSSSPAKVISATRVVRGSSSRSSRRAAATSAARIESPGSSLGRVEERAHAPELGDPMIPLPFTSAPVGSIVESEVSITIATSKPRSAPVSARARPDTKMPQASGGTAAGVDRQAHLELRRGSGGSEAWISFPLGGRHRERGSGEAREGPSGAVLERRSRARDQQGDRRDAEARAACSGMPGSSVPSSVPSAASSTGAPAQPAQSRRTVELDLEPLRCHAHDAGRSAPPASPSPARGRAREPACRERGVFPAAGVQQGDAVGPRVEGVDQVRRARAGSGAGRPARAARAGPARWRPAAARARRETRRAWRAPARSARRRRRCRRPRRPDRPRCAGRRRCPRLCVSPSATRLERAREGAGSSAAAGRSRGDPARCDRRRRASRAAQVRTSA